MGISACGAVAVQFQSRLTHSQEMLGDEFGIKIIK